MHAVSTPPDYDVVIVGGGPAGSTTGALLRTHSDARVLILEREQFPREHVGESQLPPIGAILHEMGCWDEVEAANFPIKVGATLRWGRNKELWDFDFIPNGDLAPAPRPAPFAGQRRQTAFQVDRAVYDDILLKRAQALGCEVRQQTKVTRVDRDGDRIEALVLADGQRVTARWYVDASGGVGVLRRAMDVGVQCPSSLKNVAAWDYWDDARWAESIGNGGTRVQVLSVEYGWVWHIPVTPTRASVGLVVPAEYYKQSGQSLEALYLRALDREPRVAELLQHATHRGQTKTTKDWSFVADRTYGDNWWLVGEAVGFADPILAAGMTLTHVGARELAYSLAALLEGAHDEAWLKRHYHDNQRTRIWQHIRFADFWYASNGQFTDLQEHCRTIAQDAGLALDPAEAWRWLAQGGFANDVLGQAMVGGYDLASVKQVTQRFVGDVAKWNLSGVNMLALDLDGAQVEQVPYYHQGKVVPIRSFARGDKRLLMVGPLGLAAKLVPKYPNTSALLAEFKRGFVAQMGPGAAAQASYHGVQALELLISEGWVRGSVDPSQPFVRITTPDNGVGVHAHGSDRHDQPGPA